MSTTALAPDTDSSDQVETSEQLVESATLADLWDGTAQFVVDEAAGYLGADFTMHFIAPARDSMTLDGDEIAYTYFIENYPDGGSLRFATGLATSTDGINFTRLGRVLDVGPESFDSRISSFSSVWRDGDTWYLVYEAAGSPTSNPGDVGLAVSTDGVNWVKDPAPILDHRDGKSWEDTNIGTPSLYKINGIWHLFYHGFDGSDVRIGLATGSDIRNLTRANNGDPILTTSSNGWDSGTVGWRSVIQEGDYYYMVFEGSTDEVSGSFSNSQWSSGIARSTDLIHWERLPSNPVLPQTNESFGFDGPQWVRTPDGTLHVYFRDPAGPTRRASLVFNDPDPSSLVEATLPFEEDFSDGEAESFNPLVGSWFVQDQRYGASPILGGDAVSVVHLADPLPEAFQLQATFNAAAKADGRYSNALLIFDYQDPQNFKFAGALVAIDQWTLGHRDADGWHFDLRLDDPSIQELTDHQVQILVNGNEVALYGDGVEKLSMSFADPLSNGAVGTGTRNSLTSFDNLQMAETSPPSPVNQAPLVEAGADGQVDLSEAVNLSGSASDDGLPDPPAAVTTSWSVVSGPGTVSFADATALATTATFSAEGTYVLRLTADDGDLVSSDELSVGVTDNSSSDSDPPATGATLPYQEDFSDGLADFFGAQVGDWQVEGERYTAAPAPGGDAVSVLELDQPLPEGFTLAATFNAQPPGGGWYSNALVVFDYHGPEDFKFAGALVAVDRWTIGHRDSDGWHFDITPTETIQELTDYRTELLVDGQNVTLRVGGEDKAFVSYADPLSDGTVGVGTRNAVTRFDDLSLQAAASDDPPPEPPTEASLPFAENFDDGTADFFRAPVGGWQVEAGRYQASPIFGGDAVSVLNLADPLPGSFLLGATFNAQPAANGWFSNALLIFDYQDPQNFKFAGALVAIDQWTIGHRDADGWHFDLRLDDPALGELTDHPMQVQIDGQSVTLLADGQEKLTHSFDDSLSDGTVGLGTRNAVTRFDDVTLQESP